MYTYITTILLIILSVEYLVELDTRTSSMAKIQLSVQIHEWQWHFNISYTF